MMKYGIYFLCLALIAFTNVACGDGEADRQMEEQEKPTSPPDKPSNPSDEPESPADEPENPATPTPPSDNSEEKPTEPEGPQQSEPESPEPESPKPESPPVVSSLALKQHTLEMHSGDRFSMQTTGTAVGTVKWSSSSTFVFTVSSTGVIEAKGTGTAILTVNDSQKSDQCTITVTANLDGVNQQDEPLDEKDKESLDITKIK